MEKTILQSEMLANRLRKRYRHLRKWAERTHTGAFRLYDRDIPEIPLVLDLYGDCIAGALYKRPYEKDEEEENLWLAAMEDAIAGSLEIQHENIIIKRRERQRGEAQYQKINEQGIVRNIVEGNVRFKVNLSDYLDTGLFLDRRAMRRIIAAGARGRRVLNIFCYTASFSVHAAAAGASCTDSVDLSNTYLNWARENFLLNGFSAEILRADDYFSRDIPETYPHRLIRADAGMFLRRAKTAGRQWDSIIIDPPAFSNSTMVHGDFDLVRDYRELLTVCLSLLTPGGHIWFSASARSFKTTAAELQIVLTENSPGIKVSDLSNKIIDEDFQRKKLPKAFLISSN